MTIFSLAHFYLGRRFVVHDVFPFVVVDHAVYDLVVWYSFKIP